MTTEEDFTCQNCRATLRERFSVKRRYDSDLGPSVEIFGHYDAMGFFEPDQQGDLSAGGYDLNDDSDCCAKCGKI